MLFSRPLQIKPAGLPLLLLPRSLNVPSQTLSAYVFLTTAVTIQSKVYDPEYQLIRDLFMNYSSEVRPVLNKTGEPVVVEFDMAYSQLVYLVRFINT